MTSYEWTRSILAGLQLLVTLSIPIVMFHLKEKRRRDRSNDE